MLGCSGSGKSVFSRKLRDRTGLPLIHLDNVWWRADRTHITREEFDRTLSALLEGERWILDGDYSRTYAVRFHACDTAIFLDYPEEVCMEGIVARVGQHREDMPWVAETLDAELAESVRTYRAENRPTVLELMERYPEKRSLIFTSREETEQWLAELTAPEM